MDKAKDRIHVHELVGAVLIAVLIASSVAAIRTQAHKLVFEPLSVTVADKVTDGVCTLNCPASYTISPPYKSDYRFTCSDSDGCNVYVLETGVANGFVLRISNVGASNNITVTEVAGVREMSSDWTGGRWDNMEMEYAGTTWMQTNEHNN